MDERERLSSGALALGVTLASQQADQLLKLTDELARWNRTYNLTAITERSRMVTHHLLDSLSIHAHLHGRTVADVGTGAGFPGLPLAVVNPTRAFTLVDAGGKKTRFVAHAARVLELENVTVLHARAESMRPERAFDTVVARAFAPLPVLLDAVATLCSRETRVLAMKGELHERELENIGPGWRVLEKRSLEVPGVSESRHLVTLQLVATQAKASGL
jgi:16S rRNA (guanine527-N7)-methyltransferase